MVRFPACFSNCNVAQPARYQKDRSHLTRYEMYPPWCTAQIEMKRLAYVYFSIGQV